MTGGTEGCDCVIVLIFPDSLAKLRKIIYFCIRIIRIIEKMLKILISYPLSALCVAAIWTVCLIDIPETPVSDVRLIDKWAHVSMYLVLGLLIGMEHLRRSDGRGATGRMLFSLVWLMPVIMSGVIEILQACCTGGRRSGDWLDFIANAIGSTISLIIVTVVITRRRRKGNE